MSPLLLYEYQRLDSSISFRLIHLRPGAFSDTLRCQVCIYDLETCPPFEAVSYVWGDPGKKAAITISSPFSESQLSIPENLAAALCRFRTTNLERVLWTDSICINQEDIDEKSSQVKIMGRIYRQATRVLIWLGECLHADKMDKACRTMNLINKAGTKIKALRERRSQGLPPNEDRYNTFLGINRPTTDDIHRELEIPLLNSSEYAAFKEIIIHNPWFLRAWTWQESFLAQERTFYLGTWTWPGGLLKTACIGIFTLAQMAGGSQYFEGVNHNIISMLDSAKIESMPSRIRTLPAILSIRRGSGCADERDLVYSVIGAARACPDIQANYRIPFEAVFAQSTWQIILQQGKLSILSQACRHHPPSDLPSWVPDWRTAKTENSIDDGIFTESIYTATGSSTSSGRLSDNSKVLCLAGLKWDRIKAVRSANDPEVEKWVDEQICQRVEGEIFYPQTQETLGRALRRVFHLDVIPFADEERWKPTSHEEYEAIVKNHSDDEEGRTKYGKILFAQVRARWQRSVFVTEKSRLGMAAENVLRGDVVAMLLGGDLPYVLRPIKEEEQQYNYIADAYIHGFMDGESFIEARRGAQPNYDGADTTWLDNLHRNEVPFAVQDFYLH